MVSYDEVFPYARPFHCQFHGQTWIAHDRYCSSPDCRCTDCILDFFPVTKSGSPVLKQKDAAQLTYHYRTGNHSLQSSGPEGMPPPGELLKALHRAYPDLRKRMERRRRVLREVHRMHAEQPDNPENPPAPPELETPTFALPRLSQLGGI